MMSTMDLTNRTSSLVKLVLALCNQVDNLHNNEILRAALLQAIKQLAIVLENPADAVFQTAFLVSCPLSFCICSQSLESRLLII